MPLSVPPRSGDSVNARLARAAKRVCVIEQMESRIFMDGLGFLSAPISYPISGDKNYPVVIADVNGDGIPDITTGYAAPTGANKQVTLSGGLDVLLGNGDATFQSASNQATFNHGLSFASADLNGDGTPDFVLLDSYQNYSNVPANFQVVLSNYGASSGGTGAPQGARLFGNATQTIVQPNAIANLPTTAAIGDVNGDGIPDLVAGYFYNNSIAILAGNGDGTFATATRQLKVGNGPVAIAIADLRGTYSSISGAQVEDVVVADRNDNTIDVLLNSGNGSQLIQHFYPVGNLPSAVVVADVNADGIPDIIATNSGDNTVSVLLGNGNGTFKAQQTFATGSDPVALVVADIDGDNKPDIVTANAIGQSLSVLLGNGNGTFQAKQDVALGATPASVSAANLNGVVGGPLDLVVSSNTTPVAVFGNTPQSAQVQVILNTNNNQPSINLSNGQLVVEGTTSNDGITLSVVGTSLTVEVNSSMRTLDVNSVSSISIFGFAGADSIIIGAGVPAVFAGGGGGSDTIFIQNSGNDSFRGGAGDDIIDGQTGNGAPDSSGANFVSGGAGDDTLIAGDGNDTLRGNQGNDVFIGGIGFDSISGGPGDDTITANIGPSASDPGFDTLVGGDGNDLIFQSPNDSVLPGTLGDTVRGIS